jgi:hypothetical protein
MQGVMLGILALTTALAAVVARTVGGSARVQLAPQPIKQDNISIRLPLQWRTSTGDKSDPRVIAQGVELSRDPLPRVVRVMQDRVDRPMSPLQYLQERFDVMATDDPIVRVLAEQLENIQEPIQIGKATGVLVGTHRAVPDEESYGLRNELYAAAVLPSLQVIVLHQTGSGRLDIVDQDIVRQIAAGIEVADAGEAEPPPTVITLAPGIQLQPPKGFVAMQKDDTNRTDRLFWQKPTEKTPASAEDFESNWASIEVVGCFLPTGERDRAASSIQTLLLVRDQRWRGANVTEQAGLWKVEPVAASTPFNFPARAYILPDRSGRALLAVFRAGSNGGGAFDQLWKEIESGVKFLPASDISPLERAGAAEASRLLEPAILTKIAGEREERWQLFTGPGNRPHVGWSNLDWQRGNKPAATFETRLRNFGGDIVTSTVTEWTLKDDGRQYTSESTRTENNVHDPHTLKQAVTLQRGQISIAVRADTNAASPESKFPAPKQFIPGAVLPMLMGKLDPGPLLLRTESFLDCDAAGAQDLLSVIIRPGVNDTRKAEGDEKPMRCITAEVNGSGRVSRWFFSSSGELELIELAGGVVITPSEASKIQFAFDRAGPMAP